MTTVQSPLALSLEPAISGGQLVAHWPLHTLLPDPAASRSNVYSVMPVLPTSAPSAVLAGAEPIMPMPEPMLLQPAATTAAQARAESETRSVMDEPLLCG